MGGLKVPDFTITLTGAAQNLATAVGQNYALRQIAFTADTGNANPIYIGGSTAVTSSAWGIRIPAPNTGEPAAPYIPGDFDDGKLYASDWYVIGTLNEKLHLQLQVYV